MKKVLPALFEVLGKAVVLAFFAVIAVRLIEQYFFVFGRWRDLSLYAYGFLLLLWGMAGGRYLLRQKYDWAVLALCLSLTVIAFDWWLFFVMAPDTVCKWQFWALVGFSFFAAAGCLVKRKPNMAATFAATFAAMFFGAVFLFADKTVLSAGAGVFLVYILSFAADAAGKRGKLRTAEALFYTAAALFFGGILAGLGYFYDKAPGIKFYEKRVTALPHEVKVSVIVPVYNAEKTVKRCLDSIRRQSLKDIEIIVVNDGSTDKTAAVLNEYAAHDARIKVIFQENQYVGAARNRGIKEAKGEYIGFVDADDFISPDYYEALYAAAKREDADLAAAENVFVVSNISPLVKQPYEARNGFIGEGAIYDLAAFRAGVYGYLWDKIYRRPFIEAHRIRETTLRTTAQDDFFTTLALMYADKMAVAKGAAYYYLVIRGGTSLTSFKNFKHEDAMVEMFIDLENEISGSGISDEKLKIWREAVKKARRTSFYTWWLTVKEEFKADVLAKCRAAFPEDGLDFDRKKEED